MIRQAIIKLANKKDLTYDEAAQVMNEMMSGETTQVQIAAFLTALAMKGETIEEITGCAASMRAKGVRLLHNVEALEIVGTGGDQSIPSIFQQHLRWSLLQEVCRWQNTATERHHLKAAQQIVWKPWGLIL